MIDGKVGVLFTGSSPRLWGTVICAAPSVVVWRFIPTPVGNGRNGVTATNAAAVHPHACGERIHTWNHVDL